jgi:hypothetical protein
MWIRMTPGEVASARRAQLVRAACLDGLLGVGLWFILVRLLAVLGALPSGSISGAVACGVIALILPAAWLDHVRTQRKCEMTVICDHCNVVKLADGQPACPCGGRYVPLTEMKWVGPAPVGTHPAAKAETDVPAQARPNYHQGSV